MGTRGLYVFVYKGKCYVFYNQMDSYPEALGQILVTMIKTENYKKWGELLVDKIDNKNYKIRKLKYEIGRYVEVVNDENEDQDIMEEDEWFKNSFDDKDCYMYLKWNFYDLIKNCEITKATIGSVCPTLITSSFQNSFKFERDYLNELLEINAEWIYIVDLDIQEFRIPLYNNETIEFPLNNIPFDWINKIKEKLKKN